MRMKTFAVVVAVCFGIAWLALVSRAQSSTNSLQPWLQPKNPTELEWLALERQAAEGDLQFGEDGVTVNFYLGPDSWSEGIIYCDLDYLPGTDAELVQLLEDGIQKRFQMAQRRLPWAKVKINKRVIKIR